jgi:hypothetical protein
MIQNTSFSAKGILLEKAQKKKGYRTFGMGSVSLKFDILFIALFNRR